MIVLNEIKGLPNILIKGLTGNLPPHPIQRIKHNRSHQLINPPKKLPDHRIHLLINFLLAQIHNQDESN